METSLEEILETASRHVSAWPGWMQRPEYRQRIPHTVVTVEAPSRGLKSKTSARKKKARETAKS